ncbi:MAG: type II toxin-antitoxin system PrlF family antitoxin [Dehalococcoidia bacterium]|nr:type II toxin-antitoxin system PrlF family antitoxin [Dehalococcoidia bacterium]
MNRTVREFTVTTTQRNQVTIPAEVRRILGLKPRDRVAFTIEDGGEVRLSAASFSLESAYGSVKPSTTPEDFEEISRNAKDAKVEDTLRELRDV